MISIIFQTVINQSFSCEPYDKNSTVFLIAEKQKTVSTKYTEKDKLLDDCLMPFSSRQYVVRVSKESILIFTLFTDSEKAELDVNVDGPVYRIKTSAQWLSHSYIYYISNDDDAFILIINNQANPVFYKFFIDTSESLCENNSRLLPLVGSIIAFHIDLRRGDTVFLNINSSDQFNPRFSVFVLYYEILPDESFYALYQYRQISGGTSSFTADLTGRYYVIVDSKENGGIFNLSTKVISPPWNQEWFWLLVLTLFLIITAFLTHIYRVAYLSRSSKLAFASCYFWFLTIGIAVSEVGSFSYGTSIYMPLFYLLLFLCLLSHALQIYASHLDRLKITESCQFCGREVSIREENYCCGKIVKKISIAWFLMPISLTFLFFGVSNIILAMFAPSFIDYSFMVGSCGSIVGGAIGWWINRTLYGIRKWRENIDRYEFPRYTLYVPIGIMLEGIVLAVVWPFMISFLKVFYFMQNTELLVSSNLVWLRTRVAALTIPIYMTYILFVILIGSLYPIIRRQRILRKKYS